jgi:hypothetical protein
VRLVSCVPGHISSTFRLATNPSERAHTNVYKVILMCATAEAAGNSKQYVALLRAAILQLQFRIALVKVSVLRALCRLAGLI